MTTATFYLLDGSIKGYLITGHCGLANAGQDVLCAAVSSAAYMAANTLTEVLNADITAKVQDGQMKVMISEQSLGLCQSVVQGLKIHLEALAAQHPKNLKIEYSEVY